MAVLTEAKKSGQFRAFWKSFDESVNLMTSGEVVIQSMWSPAVTAVRTKGVACVYQPLKEGYRSWGGGLGLARHLSGIELEAAYEYINWYLSGWVGALPEPAGLLLGGAGDREGEHEAGGVGFWMEGKPATIPTSRPTARRSRRWARCATAAASTSAWATSPAGTR